MCVLVLCGLLSVLLGFSAPATASTTEDAAPAPVDWRVACDELRAGPPLEQTAFRWLGWSSTYQQYAIEVRTSGCSPVLDAEGNPVIEDHDHDGDGVVDEQTRPGVPFDVVLVDVYEADHSLKRSFLKELRDGTVEDYQNGLEKDAPHRGELLPWEKIQAHLEEGGFAEGAVFDLSVNLSEFRNSIAIGPCSVGTRLTSASTAVLVVLMSWPSIAPTWAASANALTT